MIEQQIISRRSVTVVSGLSGYGKNTATIRFLINAKLSARFLFDPDPGEFNPDCGEFADRLKLEPTVTPFQLSAHLVGGWIPFDPHTLFPGDPQEGLDFFCDWAYEKSLQIPGEKAIVVDEAWKYCTPQYIPEGLRKVALSGRKARLQLYILTQEPNKLNSTLQSAMSELVCFRLQSEKSLDFVRGYSFNPDEVSKLEPLHFVARNLDSGGELRGRIKI